MLSFFRDPLGDLAFSELKMKSNHENTKVRKYEKKKGKLDRTRANSGELVDDVKIDETLRITRNGRSRANSRELFDRISWRPINDRTEEKIFEQKDTKLTK